MKEMVERDEDMRREVKDRLIEPLRTLQRNYLQDGIVPPGYRATSGGALVGEGTKVSDGTTLLKGALVSGGVAVGPRCFVGIGAVIHCRNAFIADTRIGGNAVITGNRVSIQNSTVKGRSYVGPYSTLDHTTVDGYALVQHVELRDCEVNGYAHITNEVDWLGGVGAGWDFLAYKTLQYGQVGVDLTIGCIQQSLSQWRDDVQSCPKAHDLHIGRKGEHIVPEQRQALERLLDLIEVTVGNRRLRRRTR